MFFKTISVNLVVNLCQFEDDFFVTKIRFTLFATKINKNLELSFVFVQMNAAHCIGGQNKKYDNEYYSVLSFLWTRFYNNATKIFGTEWVLCRRFENLAVRMVYNKGGSC